MVLFKDSSTNKGGVTSSSLEVLAGLGLSDEEYIDLMIFKDGKPSTFCKYSRGFLPMIKNCLLIFSLADQSYVKDIQQKICENAAQEYTCITKEWLRNKGTKARTTISDQLSSTLNQLQAELEQSDLYENVGSRKNVLNKAFPKTLVDKVGLETLMQRLPEQVSRVHPKSFSREEQALSY